MFLRWYRKKIAREVETKMCYLGTCPNEKEIILHIIDSATFDEDAMFGDGIMRSCPFGADRFGCLVERPHNCPIVGRKDL